METLLTYATNTVVVGAVCLAIGVLFSQKIKDYIGGVPSGLRATMNSVEAKAMADAKAAVADVLAKLTPAPVVQAAPPPAVTPPPAEGGHP